MCAQLAANIDRCGLTHVMIAFQRRISSRTDVEQLASAGLMTMEEMKASKQIVLKTFDTLGLYNDKKKLYSKYI